MTDALLSYEQAGTLVAAYAAERGLTQCPVERVELGRSTGRVLARPLYADRDQPAFARSTRDGFACRAAEAATHEFLAVAGASRAGESSHATIPPRGAWEIMTGAPVPSGADAVMMIEHVHLEREDTPEGHVHLVRLLPERKIESGENVVMQGSQAREGDLLLPAGTAMYAPQIALAAACGYASVEVFVRPRVAILTTGDELVPVKATPGPGQIRNSNAPMLAAMVTAAGGEPWVLPTAADNPEALDDALARAAEADLLLVSGGVSAGKFDLVEPALSRAGALFHFTGVRMQPGKPLVFGELPRSHNIVKEPVSRMRTLPFFGLPGNPVSSAVTFLLFAAPVLAALAGNIDSSPQFALAQLAAASDRHGAPGLTRFLPARCDFGRSANVPPQVTLVPWQGSGDLTALARSNCFVVVPEKAPSLDSGTIVRILLLS